jgi:hypothetical protein
MDEPTSSKSGGGGFAPDHKHDDDVSRVVEHKSGGGNARDLLVQSGTELTKAGASLFVNMLPANVRAEAETVLSVQTSDEDRHIAASNMLAGIPEEEVPEPEEEGPKEEEVTTSMVQAFMLGN